MEMIHAKQKFFLTKNTKTMTNQYNAKINHAHRHPTVEKFLLNQECHTRK